MRTRALEWVALGCSTWALAVALYLMAVRLVYPYELEWLEGAMLHLVERVAAGEPLYAEPTLEYTMCVYAPLYYWLSAGLSTVIGEGPIGPRLVSIGATLGTLALIWRLARRSGADRAAAFVGVGLYAASFDAGDGYQDAIRVDSLFVFLLTVSVYGMRFWPGVRGASLAGLALAASFAAKQSSLLVPLPMFAVLWWARGVRDAVAFVVAFAIPVVAELGVLAITTGGWSSWFLLGQLGGHEVDAQMWLGFWTSDIAKVLGIAFVVAFFQGASMLWRRDRGEVVLATAAALMIGIAYASRLHSGGGVNVVYPAWVAIAVLACISLARARAGGARDLGFALVIAQLGWLFAVGNPFRLLPTPEDRAGGEELVAELRALDGPTLVPYHGWLARRAGKTQGSHPVAINDVLRSGDAAVVDAFRAETRDALASRRYRWIVLDQTVNDPWFAEVIREYYRPARPLLSSARYRWLNAKQPFEIVVFEPR